MNQLDIDYESVIIDLGNRLAQLTIDNAILTARVKREMELKEQVEQEYMKTYTELNALKTKRGDI